MTPKDWTLIVAAESTDGPLEPVQLQKALFLIGRLGTQELKTDAFYDFVPYDYGPFCGTIYSDAESLELSGLMVIQRPPQSRYKRFSVTATGAEQASRLKAELSDRAKSYLGRIVTFVRTTSFDQLVQAIYKTYPEMAANSVFSNRP